MSNPTKVDQAKEKLRELMVKQQEITDDPFISRREMYNQLRDLRNEFTQLVQVVAPF